MPQPIVLGDTSGLAQGIVGFGNALGQALQQRTLQNRQLQDQNRISTSLNQALGSLNQDSSPLEIVGAFNKALATGVPVDQAKAAFSFYEPILKKSLEETQDRRFLQDLGIMKGESKAPVAVEGDSQTTYSNASFGPQSWTEDQIFTAASSGSKRLKDVADAELKRRELNLKKEDSLWNYKPTQEFIKSIEEEAKDAEFSNQVADEIIDLAPRVDPKNIRTFLASKYGDKLPMLFTEESAKLKLLEKLQAKGLKAYFPRPTEREFFFINSAQAQLGKTPEANLAVANLQKRFNSLPMRLAEIKDEIIEENGGAPPRDLVAQVRKRANRVKNDLITQSAAITYRYGEGEDQIKAKEYLDSIGSPVAKERLPLTEEITKKIFIEVGGDPEKATQRARELGYDI